MKEIHLDTDPGISYLKPFHDTRLGKLRFDGERFFETPEILQLEGQI